MPFIYRTRFLLQMLSVCCLLFLFGTVGAFETERIGFHRFLAQAALFGVLSLLLHWLGGRQRRKHAILPSPNPGIRLLTSGKRRWRYSA